jgi:hypothetical protein
MAIAMDSPVFSNSLDAEVAALLETLFFERSSYSILGIVTRVVSDWEANCVSVVSQRRAR